MRKQHADTHAALEGCTGWHIPAALDPEELGWLWPYGIIRVLEHTCDRCAAVSYELGMLGGAYVIRRTDRTHFASKGTIIRQTPTVRKAVVLPWWEAVRQGRAV